MENFPTHAFTHPSKSTLAMLKKNSIQTAHTHINEIENVFFFLFLLSFLSFFCIFLEFIHFLFYFLKWILSMYDYVCPTTIRTPTTATATTTIPIACIRIYFIGFGWPLKSIYSIREIQSRHIKVKNVKSKKKK